MPETESERSTLQNTVFSGLRKLIASSKYFLLFSLNCLLLTLAWHDTGTAFLIFITFVPLFIILTHPPRTFNERLGSYILAFLTVFLFIYFTIYWIQYVSPTTHFITTLVGTTTMLCSTPYCLTIFPVKLLPSPVIRTK